MPTKQLVEPAGAAGYAALMSGAVTAKDQTVAIVLSGGNVDMARLVDHFSQWIALIGGGPPVE